MARAIRNEATDSKVCLLMLKITEESIKRAYMKAQVQMLIPASGLENYNYKRSNYY